jgi:hypothetical protein
MIRLVRELNALFEAKEKRLGGKSPAKPQSS